MLKKLATLPFLIAASSFAAADSYRFDANVYYGSTEIDLGYGYGYDIDTLGVAGTAYFKDVETGGLPLAEAAFLNHASSVGVGYSESEVGDFDASATNLRASVFVPETVLYLGVDYTDAEGNDDANVNLTAGYYKNNLLITTTYNDDVDYELNLAAKYVMVNGDGTAWNFQAGFQQVDEGDDVVTLGADYFFTPAVSVGAVYSSAGSDDAIGVKGQVFASENLYFTAEYTDSEFSDGYSLTAGVRF